MPTRALIKKDNLYHNIALIRSAIVDPQTKVCVSVKSNAYGHGLKEVALALDNMALDDVASNDMVHNNDIVYSSRGIDYFGLAHNSEARALRSYGIRTAILLYSHQEVTELEDAIHNECEFVVGDIEYLQHIIIAAQKTKKTVAVHLKYESGMGRLGMDTIQFEQAYVLAHKNPYIQPKGICTHLSDSSSHTHTKGQIEKFERLLQALAIKKHDYIIHCANSGAIFRYPEYQYSMVRPGISLYGAMPNNDLGFNDTKARALKPVMELQASVVSIKPYPKGWGVSYNSLYTTPSDTYIAVICAGYGDGVPISFSNKADVMIEGRRYPIIGRVTMDLIMVDLGADFKKEGEKDGEKDGEEHIRDYNIDHNIKHNIERAHKNNANIKVDNTRVANIRIGSTVTLWGSEGLSVEEQAHISGELNYTLLTGVMGRVPRVLV